MLYDALDTFINIFADSGAIMLILCGIMAMIWFLHEGYRKGGFIHPKKEEWDYDNVSKALKIIIYLGVVLGIIMIATGVVTIMADLPPSFKYVERYGDALEHNFDWLTSVALIVLGLAMFLKPMLDIPWATIIGVVAGSAVGIVLVLAIPDDFIDWAGQVVNMRNVLIVLFLVVSTLVGMSLKFWISGIETLAKIISWPPVALLIAIFCFVQGFGLWTAGWTIYLF